MPIDYTTLDYSAWSPIQRVARLVFALMIRLFARLDVEGLEHVPAQGPLLLTVNHLHLFDSPLIFRVLPRRAVVFAASKFRNNPFIHGILVYVGNAIYVERGEVDRRALSSALKVLQAGGVLAIAPEGTRSRTGMLSEGRTGAAYLATRANVPILPLVAYGQEKAPAYWKRLRRVPIHVRIGRVMELPAGKASMDELQTYTEQIMLALAHLLPADYHGVYANRLTPPIAGDLAPQIAPIRQEQA